MKQHQPIPLGTVYGRLTVVGPPMRVKGVYHYQCLCACGTYAFVRGTSLTYVSRPTRSCGCLQMARATHGLHGHKLYDVWAGMKQRCCNPKQKDYPNYGGRGITVCEEWQASFESFAVWAFAHGYQDGLQIDRIDNDGNYEPTNCHFVTCSENSRNRRSNLIITAFGTTKCLAAWAEDPRCIVTRHCLTFRIHKLGWEVECALTTPARVVLGT